MIKPLIYLLLLVITAVTLLVLAPSEAEAKVRIKGYMRGNGTYVQPYYRSNPNYYKFDNWSSRGNINLYTGRKGYKRW